MFELVLTRNRLSPAHYMCETGEELENWYYKQQQVVKTKEQALDERKFRKKKKIKR